MPEGHVLDDVYAPIRAAIEKILTPQGTAAGAESEPISEKDPNSNSANLPQSTTEDGKPINYYTFIHRETDEPVEADDPEGEKFLMTEIGKFRQRQMLRDK